MNIIIFKNFYEFSFKPINSKMYVIIEDDKALIIDCIKSEEAIQLLKQNNVTNIKIILTHEHFDHIIGINDFKNNFDCSVICSEKCFHNIKLPIKNFSKMSEALFMNSEEHIFIPPFSAFADNFFSEDVIFNWKNHKIECKITPGHSEGSICVILDDKYLFSGDTLVDGYKIITRLPGGNKKQYKEITLPYLKSLSKDIIVFPGHGNVKNITMFAF